MNHREKRQFLIQALLKERPEYRDMRIPTEPESQRQLLRGLMNIRAPRRMDAEVLKTQDEYLQAETAAKGITDLDDLTPVQPGLYFWQGDITTLRCDAYSSMQWLEQAQQQTDMIQAVLGGIGAVSLFVAAIGIANTMMMSIYERTKEIGVLKVLGCALGDIRTMFLMEAGFIGFMGGVLGLGLSYSVSAAINKFLGASLSGMTGGSGAISRIPLWLSGSAVVFAVLIGMLAGLFPALRAMKLSPLAAIRNE